MYRLSLERNFSRSWGERGEPKHEAGPANAGPYRPFKRARHCAAGRVSPQRGTPANGFKRQPATANVKCASVREAVQKHGDSWAPFAPKGFFAVEIKLELERRNEEIVMRCYEEGRMSRVRPSDIAEGERLGRAI